MSPSNYHEDLRTPGIMPSLASSRKQIRHKLKSRIKPCRRPQRKHRFTFRVENFGFFFDLAMTEVLAIWLRRYRARFLKTPGGGLKETDGSAFLSYQNQKQSQLNSRFWLQMLIFITKPLQIKNEDE